LKKSQQKEKRIEVSFHRCKTSKQIIYLWYALDSKKPLSTIVDLYPFTGKKKLMGPVSKAIKSAERFRKWGFYRRKSKKSYGGEIFFWVSDKGDALDLLHLFAHEIAHSAGYRDEDEANRIAAICTFTAHSASKFSKGMIKLK
jgi:hypothetical protein